MELAKSVKRPMLAVEVYAPVAVREMMPLVATAPVVAEERLNKLPEVRPVPVEATRSPTPVVKALA